MAASGLRRLRVGLLGLGTVGEAVARAAARAARDRLAITIDCALVRDAGKRRHAPAVSRVTDNAEAFLRGRYDVVIDALAGREPAATLAARLLGKGVPVVSANKAMLAFDAPRLRRVAARSGATLRVDAAAIAGVPFIGNLERRPLAGRVERFTGVLNGTSHFVVTRLAGGDSIEEALADAQARGFAEPDPSADISGRDARDKLVVLAAALLGAVIEPDAVDVDGIGDLTPQDFEAASRLGGVIKPVAFAARTSRAVSAFTGAAWLPGSHSLAGISGVDNGIAIEGRHIPRLFFAGPGAGPDVTAATLLDDAVEAVAEQKETPVPPRDAVTSRVTAPDTGSFVRVSGRDVARALPASLAADGVRRVDIGGSAWLLLPATAARAAADDLAALETNGASLRRWRALDV